MDVEGLYWQVKRRTDRRVVVAFLGGNDDGARLKATVSVGPHQVMLEVEMSLDEARELGLYLARLAALRDDA